MFVFFRPAALRRQLYGRNNGVVIDRRSPAGQGESMHLQDRQVQTFTSSPAFSPRRAEKEPRKKLQNLDATSQFLAR
jgi:hypothetical protein